MRGLVAGKDIFFNDRGDTELREFEDQVRAFEVRWRRRRSPLASTTQRDKGAITALRPDTASSLTPTFPRQRWGMAVSGGEVASGGRSTKTLSGRAAVS